jgi:tRNA pseudouridine38/39 synthase
METKIEKLKKNLYEMNKDEIVKRVLSACVENATVLNIISKSIKTDISAKINEKIKFNIQKHMAFKFMYIGKNYDGLVTQKDTRNTIEEHIFNALKTASLIQSEDTCNYSRCGRTDAGVSSIGNVFDLDLRYKEGIDYIKILNTILPDDIRIIGSAEVRDDFDSRFSCLFREYKYFFVGNDLNIDMMKEGCSMLEGMHNFRNFCKIDRSQSFEKSYIRRIYSFKIEKYKMINDFDIYNVTIRGSAFLWHQVRCMMGILFLVGKGLEEISLIDGMLDVDKSYTYNYEIASDLPLVLTDCQFEGIDFKISVENSAENFFRTKSITEKVLLDTSIHSFILENYKKQIQYDQIEKFKRKKKYTKLLNHKSNRKINNLKNKHI